MLSSRWDKGPVAHEEKRMLAWKDDKTQCITIVLSVWRLLQLPCLILNSLSCSLYKGENVESVAQTCSHSQEANKSMEGEFVPDFEPLFAEKENWV